MTAVETAQPKPWPRQPLLAGLMRSPGACRLLAALLAAHFGLMLLGFTGWTCPAQLALDHPCPGCGLSRSVVAIGRGHFSEALSFHAFGPLAGAAILVLVVSGFLPRAARESLTRFVERFETVTGFSHIMLLLFLAYWLVRMVAGHGSIAALA